MAKHQGTDSQLEGKEGSLNLTAPSVSHVSVSSHDQNLVITASSLREAVDDAMSARLPSLIKKALMEASKPKPKSMFPPSSQFFSLSF